MEAFCSHGNKFVLFGVMEDNSVWDYGYSLKLFNYFYYSSQKSFLMKVFSTF